MHTHVCVCEYASVWGAEYVSVCMCACVLLKVCVRVYCVSIYVFAHMCLYVLCALLCVFVSVRVCSLTQTHGGMCASWT